MKAFVVCWLIGLALIAVNEAKRPQMLIRSLQEGRYGGALFFLVASSLTIAVPLWLVFKLIAWIAL